MDLVIRRFPPDLHRIAWRKLAILDAAERLEDLRIPPGNRLEGRLEKEVKVLAASLAS
jgi:proteic killer suppression protein